jgi:hypothetical protein
MAVGCKRPKGAIGHDIDEFIEFIAEFIAEFIEFIQGEPSP